jgi:hypothetical protein
MSVDPKKIFSLLVDSGLLIPEEARSDIALLRRVCSADKAELNLVDKCLVLHNFRIGVHRHKPALRVDLLALHWDSYKKPSLDVEVRDVHISVEFTNILLTRNNWSELNDAGFPPTLTTGRRGRHQEAFVRFHDIDLSGNVTVRLTSRPLDREIGVISMNMDQLNDLGLTIRQLSESNFHRSRRRGCTPEELEILLQTYFARKVKRFLQTAADEIKTDPGKAIKTARRHARTAGGSAMRYAEAAGRKTGEDIHRTVVTRKRGAVDRIDKARKESITRTTKWTQKFHRVKAWAEKAVRFDNESTIPEEAPKVFGAQDAVTTDDADAIIFSDW